MRTIILLPFNANKHHEFDAALNEKEIFKFDWTNRVGRNSTTLSTVTWTSQVGTVTIDTPVLTAQVSQAAITFGEIGKNLIELKATYANGEIDYEYLKVRVVDLSYCNSRY